LTPPPLQNCACDFHRTRLLSIRAVVTSATTIKLTIIAACLLFRLNGRVLVILCGFQYVKDVCHTCTCAASAGVKPDILPLPKASRTPCPRQRTPHLRCGAGVLRLSRRRLLVSTGSTQVLGDLSRLGLRLVACSIAGEPQTGYSVPHIHFALVLYMIE